MKIILASGSPRRRELLTQIGISFEVIVSQVEEVITTTSPKDVVMELSCQKATAVWQELIEKGETDFCVLGADTVVAKDGSILGKPQSEADAIAMLQMLEGDTHEVYTGVTILLPNGQKISFAEETSVEFYPMSQDEIKAYVATKDPMDKAGSYGIQGLCARHISGIRGDYNNVVGLPVARVYQELKSHGLL